MNGSDPKLSARELLEEAHPALVGLSHWIHANPETGFQESLAAGWVAEWLVTGGFEVETGVAGMPTALVGRTGPGPFHVAVCVEYDALPEVGHACGHNVIAATSVGAALALASVAEELGLRITVLGTPAEETGGGKLRLLDAGAFDGVHAALMVHPWPTDVATPSIIAVNQLEVTYTGREAHAAGFPQRGLNAADALVVAQTAIGLLRQQLLPTDRVHGIVTRGGDAPNIIPAHTTALYMVRAHDRARMDELTQLVTRCFEAGALATGTEVTVVEGTAYANMVHDADLAALYRHNAELLGRVFDDFDRIPVSTDMGNVSHVVPSIHPMIGIDADGAVNHQAAFTDACATPSADQAILDGAVALAWTVIDAAQDEVLRGRLIAEGMAREALALAVEAEVLEEDAAALAEAAEAIAPVDPDAAEELALAAIVLDAQAQDLTDEAIERLDEAAAVQDEALLDEVAGELASDAEDLEAEGLEMASVSDDLAAAAAADLEVAEALEDEADALEQQAEALADIDPDGAEFLATSALALDAQAQELKDDAEIEVADAADLADNAVFVMAAASDLAEEADILAQVEPELLEASADAASDGTDWLTPDQATGSNDEAGDLEAATEGIAIAAIAEGDESLESADTAADLADTAADLADEAAVLDEEADAFAVAAVDETIESVELGEQAESLGDEAATLAFGAWAFTAASDSALDDVADDAAVAVDAAEEAAEMDSIADDLVADAVESAEQSAELSAEADALAEEAVAVAASDPDAADELAASAFEFETRAEATAEEATASFELALEAEADAAAADDLAEVATEAAEDAAAEADADAVVAEELAEEAVETDDLAEVVLEASEDAARTASSPAATLGRQHADWEQQFLVISAHATWEDEYARMLADTSDASTGADTAQATDAWSEPEPTEPTEPEPTEPEVPAEEAWYSGAPASEASELTVGSTEPADAESSEAIADESTESDDAAEPGTPAGDFEWIPAGPAES